MSEDHTNTVHNKMQCACVLQDTTGPMTRDELKDLACLGFSADLVMQSFCHTAAYPKPVDVNTHSTLPDFIRTRGGVALRPGDGIIHSWLNRMLMPDGVGTGDLLVFVAVQLCVRAHGPGGGEAPTVEAYRSMLQHLFWGPDGGGF